MLPLPVIVVGLVSLFTDVSSEMIVPLLPAFLAARLVHPAFILGAMEGVADATSAFLKYFSGRWADRGVRLKPLVVGGYLLASVARPMMGWVTRAWEPIAIRVADRVGKGIRSSPRDAMIAGFTNPGTRGRAFGFHNAMDNAGATVGALAAMVMTWAGIRIDHIFFWAAVPAGLAVLAVLFTREPPVRPALSSSSTAQTKVPRRLWAFLVPVIIFGVGNSTDTFVLLKLTEVGATAGLLPFAWLLLNAVKALVSYPAGALADRIRPSRVVSVGWALYATSYALLAFSTRVMGTVAVIAFYGLYHALSEGTEKALLTELVPPESRGRAFGLYNGLSGGAVLVAGLAFGAVWTRWGSRTAFLGAAGFAGAAALLLVLLLPIAAGGSGAQAQAHGAA